MWSSCIRTIEADAFWLCSCLRTEGSSSSTRVMYCFKFENLKISSCVRLSEYTCKQTDQLLYVYFLLRANTLVHGYGTDPVWFISEPTEQQTYWCIRISEQSCIALFLFQNRCNFMRLCCCGLICIDVYLFHKKLRLHIWCNSDSRIYRATAVLRYSYV